MRLNCALLCDAVSIREGLLHILGGGVNRITAPDFPTRLLTVLAMHVALEPDEAETDHRIELVVRDVKGERVGGAQGGFLTGRPSELHEGEDVAVPLVVPLDSIEIGVPGVYELEVRIDDVEGALLSFLVARATPPDSES